MQRILICTGVLGGGTAIVFLLAAMTAALFPNGTMVNAGWNGGWAKGGMEVVVEAQPPMIMPADGGPIPGGLDVVVDGVQEK